MEPEMVVMGFVLLCGIYVLLFAMLSMSSDSEDEDIDWSDDRPRDPWED